MDGILKSCDREIRFTALLGRESLPFARMVVQCTSTVRGRGLFLDFDTPPLCITVDLDCEAFFFPWRTSTGMYGRPTRYTPLNSTVDRYINIGTHVQQNIRVQYIGP